MVTAEDNAAIRPDEKDLREVVDLTWENVSQILETLDTLPTKDEMNARFDELLDAINNHTHP